MLHRVRYGAQRRNSGIKPTDVNLKRVKLHDTDSIKLSASTASNSTLP
jgi:hypothetical protein